MSSEQRKRPICIRLGAYIYIIYKFSYLYCMLDDNGMEKVEVNDAHDNDDH